MAGATNQGFDTNPQNINRKGRPRKAECLTDILKAQGDLEDVDANGKRISRKQAIAQKLWSMAMSGDVTALKYLYDRVDGKPTQSILADVSNRNEVDLSRYTAEELKQLAELNRKSRS